MQESFTLFELSQKYGFDIQCDFTGKNDKFVLLKYSHGVFYCKHLNDGVVMRYTGVNKVFCLCEK